jgi:ribosomal protein L37AE/L43A
MSGATVYTGLQAGLHLDNLHRRVRRVAGRTKLVHRLTPACPWCDARSLVRHNGSDQVECESCGKIIEQRHYSWFVKTLCAQEDVA